MSQYTVIFFSDCKRADRDTRNVIRSWKHRMKIDGNPLRLLLQKLLQSIMILDTLESPRVAKVHRLCNEKPNSL